jgi:coatomer subunit gamma
MRLTPAVFSCTLKFLVRDCDPTTGEVDEGGYDDEYQVEDLDLSVGDYVLPHSVPQFDQTFSQLQHQAVETYVLSQCSSIAQCITLISEQLGLQPTDRIVPTGPAGQVSLSGIFVGGVGVLAKCRMVHELSSGVTLEICVRSGNAAVSQKVVDGIQ